jgi:predicted MPP superfamily phosphohydrolase
MKKTSLWMRIILTLLLFNGILFYIGWNIFEYLSTFSSIPPAIFWILFFFLGYSYFLDRLSPFLSFSRILGSFMIGFIQYAIMLLPAANISVWLARIAGVESATAIFWAGNITILIFVLIFGLGMYNAYNPVVREYKVSIPKSLQNRRALRITMASDMHFGRLSGRTHARRLVREVNATKPDIILLAGDVIDDELDPFTEKNFGDILRGLHAPLGIFGVLGNHEYYGGQVTEYIEEMNRIGIRILTDEAVFIDDSFYLVGRKDKTDRQRKPYADLVSPLPKDYPIISMDHQPTDIAKAADAFVDLSFSGHTHRGQMAPNHFITKRIFELDWGYLQKRQLHAFVSSGFGFWGPPLRLGSRSEIIQVDVTAE